MNHDFFLNFQVFLVCLIMTAKETRGSVDEQGICGNKCEGEEA
jgi:hypothetical protein